MPLVQVVHQLCLIFPYFTFPTTPVDKEVPLFDALFEAWQVPLLALSACSWYAVKPSSLRCYQRAVVRQQLCWEKTTSWCSYITFYICPGAQRLPTRTQIGFPHGHYGQPLPLTSNQWHSNQTSRPTDPKRNVCSAWLVYRCVARGLSLECDQAFRAQSLSI